MAALASVPVPPSGAALVPTRETVSTTTLVPHPTHKHVWRVEGVTPEFFTAAAVGKRLDSPPFTALGKEWCLRLYANGSAAESVGNLGIHLMLLSPDTTIAPAVTLAIHTVVNLMTSAFCTRSPRTKDASNIWGWSTYMTHARFLPEVHTYAPGGVLCVTATLRDPEWANPTTAGSVDVPPPSLSADLGALLASGERTDVTLVCRDGERVAAHAFVLCLRSPVFTAQLREGPLRADTCAVPVPPDITPHTLHRLLHFLYTDELEPASPEEATHLLNAADHYGVPRLLSLCERALCAALTVDNAAETLTLADQHGAAALKREALRFVVANAAAVLATPGWAHLLVARPSLVNVALHMLATGAPPPAPLMRSPQDGAGSEGASDDAARRVRQRTR
jgi:speckle-type POZ protein